MATTNLDVQALRTLKLAMECGSFGEAGARLGRTPSAVSLQMKKLQDQVGAPLFRKAGRGLALTDAGEIVLTYARRIVALNDELLSAARGATLQGEVRLGIAQDFAESVLPAALRRFQRSHPLVRVDLRVEGNRTLAEGVERSEIDLALVLGQAERATATTLGGLDLVWIADEQFALAPGEPVPLVALGSQCAFRAKAVAALESQGAAWRLAAVSQSLTGLWGAVRGGLGVTLRTALACPPFLRASQTLNGLPTPGVMPVTLHARPCLDTAGTRLRDLLVEEAGLVTSPALRKAQLDQNGSTVAGSADFAL